MSIKDKIRELIWMRRHDYLYSYDETDASLRINLRTAKYKEKYGLNIDIKNVMILDDNLIFTHESLYCFTNDELKAIPFYDIKKIVTCSDGSLEFQLHTKDQSVYIKDDNLVPDKTCKLFEQIVDIIGSESVSYKDQIIAEEKSQVFWSRIGSIVFYVVIVAIILFIVFAFVTCARACSDDSTIEDIPILEGTRDKTADNMFKDDELSHIIVNIEYNIKKKSFACEHKGYFLSIVKYAISGDQRNYHTLLGTGLLTGECIYFNVGETVVLKETSYDKAEVRLSRVGESKSYWTFVEAIE